MSQNTDKLEKIIRQSSRWIIFGCISPIAYIVIAHLMFVSDWVSFDNIVWCASGILVIVCFIWWFWTLKVIMMIGVITGQAKKDLTTAIDDVKMIKQEVEESNNLFKEIIKNKK
jgi:uncharacterized membrane protein